VVVVEVLVVVTIVFVVAVEVVAVFQQVKLLVNSKFN
jgi:hypothetical protein